MIGPKRIAVHLAHFYGTELLALPYFAYLWLSCCSSFQSLNKYSLLLVELKILSRLATMTKPKVGING